jgi:hypothetical protein
MSFTLGLRAARLAWTPTLSLPRATVIARNYSSPSNPTKFSAPTHPALNSDEAKNRPGYEEYREEVEPKYANVDQTFVFEEPKVCPPLLSFSHSFVLHRNYFFESTLFYNP